MTPEGKVKKQIKEILKQYNCYYFMPVQNGMGAPSVDFLCCLPWAGTFLAIEAKAPGKKATARQVMTMKSIEAANGFTFVCDGGNIDELETLIVKLLMLSKVGNS